MHIKELDRDRMVRVYLPMNYNENKNERYSVLYMQDGHNLFYKETSSFGGIWNAQKALSDLEKETGKGIILVGIDCNNKGGRFDEYSPWVNPELDKIIPSRKERNAGGEGSLYVDFLVNTLKPYIDSKYRTLINRENTYIAGSSMGAFISLYAGYRHPEIFSVIGAFSTAIWFKKDKLFEFITDNYVKGLKVYLDIGTKETSDQTNNDFNKIYLEDTKELYNRFIDLNHPNEDLHLLIDEGANHSEASWEKRFPIFLKWIDKF